MISESDFGTARNGRKVSAWTLKNTSGMEVTILSYACAIQKILVPDRSGAIRDVVLGYDTLREYEDGIRWFGAVIGRYANRIRNAEFTLNGITYHLPANDGKNHLHGVIGKRIYSGEVCGDRLVLRSTSPAGDEGFPGNLSFSVTYELTDANELKITYRAETDADTVLNFSNHSYFNLNGQDSSTILNHVLKLDCDCYTEGGPGTIPTGRILPVEGTVMDFRSGKTIGRDIESGDAQLTACRGYDHNFVVRGEAGTLREAAVLESPESGIRMTCLTTQPGMQLYTGNYVEGPSAVGKKGIRYPLRGAVCLETQHYPCSPNYPEFPTTVLHPGETYCEQTVYRFDAE